ncbi:protein CDV3 homolog [Teleopsis dalmanni]|uniref:protein CDV3 homolog n=1 Tax=Teleopsis dalmanni TaxID=139649 RepID=UPI0018CCE524|nr:protein CDV3 homolog [Teleopsis dalmanni]XP_037955529.1 protein CDV3 homolog [Teleopsis dalmanni]
MADLDDFFAKKDKKKSKAKKFTTADDVVKNLEDTSKREVSLKPRKPEILPPVAGNLDENNSKEQVEEPTNEEEWKEFEEETRKDYTGLKIGQLTINEDEEHSVSDGDDDEGDSDQNSNNESSKRHTGGPWKKVIPAEEVLQIPMEVQKPANKLYVSVAFRQGPPKIKARSKAAPDITNADFFPTLGAARPEEQRKKKNEPAFEEVRHGGRVQRIQEQQTVAPANASNRFQSLDEDDS